MCIRFPLYLLLVHLIVLFPITARADLVAISIEGEFYSASDQVTVGPYGLNYSASFVFETIGTPDLVEFDRETYNSKLVSGSLSVGAVNATFGSDISNFAVVDTQPLGDKFIELLQFQIGRPSRFPAPPIQQTGGDSIGLLSRMILLFKSDQLSTNIPLTFDEAMTEAEQWSFTPIVGFRDIPGVGYHEFYSTVSKLTFDRQSVASVDIPSPMLLILCSLFLLRRTSNQKREVKAASQ